MLLFMIAVVFIICRIARSDEARINARQSRSLPAARQTFRPDGEVFEAEDIGPSGGFTVK